jgi:hypothetical protein
MSFIQPAFQSSSLPGLGYFLRIYISFGRLQFNLVVNALILASMLGPERLSRSYQRDRFGSGSDPKTAPSSTVKEVHKKTAARLLELFKFIPKE